MSAWETYRDIIDLPYPTRSRHPRMPIGDRAAQFAPFAALTGFGAVLRETERITEMKKRSWMRKYGWYWKKKRFTLKLQ